MTHQRDIESLAAELKEFAESQCGYHAERNASPSRRAEIEARAPLKPAWVAADLLVQQKAEIARLRVAMEESLAYLEEDGVRSERTGRRIIEAAYNLSAEPSIDAAALPQAAETLMHATPDPAGVGIPRSSVLQRPGVKAYYVDPSDTSKIVQEDAAGNKVRGCVVGGEFQPDGQGPAPADWRREIWNSAVEAAALVVQPIPHTNEERTCAEFATAIRALKQGGLTGEPSADEAGLTACVTCGAPAEVHAEPDMPAICAALGFGPTNHHNAAKCPYCRPAMRDTEALTAEHMRLVEKLISTTWSWGESCGVDGVPISGVGGDSHNGMCKDMAESCRRAVEASARKLCGSAT